MLWELEPGRVRPRPCHQAMSGLPRRSPISPSHKKQTPGVLQLGISKSGDQLNGAKLMWPWVEIQIVPSVNIPTPTKIGPKMGGEFTYPRMGSHWQPCKCPSFSREPKSGRGFRSPGRPGPTASRSLGCRSSGRASPAFPFGAMSFCSPVVVWNVVVALLCFFFFWGGGVWQPRPFLRACLCCYGRGKLDFGAMFGHTEAHSSALGKALRARWVCLQISDGAWCPAICFFRGFYVKT